MQDGVEQAQGGTVAAAPGGVLRRLIDANRPADAPASPPPPPAARSPERVIAAAVSRAADNACGLSLFFDGVRATHLQPAELLEYLPEQGLICLVEGAGDSLGVVSICPGLLTALIEMQALGRVTSRAAAPRRPTRTDAAICADFINACLAELGTDLASVPGFGMVRGFRYAGFLPDARPLDLMLDDGIYRRIELKLRTGDAGQRDGTMTIVLPCRSPARAIAGTAPPALSEPSRAGADAGEKVAGGAGSAPAVATTLAPAVQDSPVTLHGVLCRRRVGLGQLRALLGGQPLPLPRSVLDHATLETATGQVLAHGRLGESEGRPALRLRAVGTASAGTRDRTDGTSNDMEAGGLMGGIGGDMGITGGMGMAVGMGGADDDAPVLSDLPPPDLGAPDPFRPDGDPASGLADLPMEAPPMQWDDEPHGDDEFPAMAPMQMVID